MRDGSPLFRKPSKVERETMRKFLMLILVAIVVAGALAACSVKEFPGRDFRGGRETD